MVRCFIACSLVPPQGVLQTVSYTTDAATESLKRSVEGADAADRVRAQLRTNTDSLAERIISECTTAFAMQLPGKPMSAVRDQTPQAGVEAMVQGSGVFRTRQGAPYCSQMLVHWHRLENLAFALVRDPKENAVAVEMTLQHISRALLKHINSAVATPSELILHPEKVTAILDLHMPNGLPLLLNRSIVAQTEQELDKIFAD